MLGQLVHVTLKVAHTVAGKITVILENSDDFQREAGGEERLSPVQDLGDQGSEHWKGKKRSSFEETGPFIRVLPWYVAERSPGGELIPSEPLEEFCVYVYKPLYLPFGSRHRVRPAPRKVSLCPLPTAGY